MLLNVGPDRHGQIPQSVAKVLRSTGKWFEQVGDTVYETRGAPGIPKMVNMALCINNTIYVYFLAFFKGYTFTLPTLNKGQKVVSAYVVSDKKPVKFKQNKAGEITLSNFDRADKIVTIIVVELNTNVID